jgi:dTDP-4-dehydrorhamnose reductase
MKVLVTGASGTVGSVLCEHLCEKNIQIEKWNRSLVPPGDYQRMKDYITNVNPPVLFHLAYAPKGTADETWKINYEWPSELAWITKLLGVKFIFISTNLIFSNQWQGPFTIEDVADAPSGYGFEKRMAEERVRSQNPQSVIIRLGWQIGKTPGGNNMIDFFERKMRTEGVIKASVNWKPACSFLEDSCEKIADIGLNFSAATYQLDSNERWDFFSIATALNKFHGTRWNIVRTKDYTWDSRMKDDRTGMPLLNERLKLP